MSKTKTEKPFAGSGDVTEIILESISEGVFTVDGQWRITTFNRAAEKITGVPREMAIGKHCWEVFRSNMCEGDCALRRTMKMGKNYIDSATYIVDAEQQRIPVVVCTSLLKDENGNVLGGVETFRDMTMVEELRKELDSRFEVGDLVSRSANMQRIFGVLPKIAESETTVVIEGETGTGKELLARAIHELSPRREKPFIAINCGALPDTLLESELFGYKVGAFTDAVKDKPGRFALAEGGSIFLDEIGDVSPAFQVKLLRILQERMFQPLGATHEVKADVRVIAATNRNLRESVKNGSFREDLFYRLNVVQLELPPLRERRADIPLLVEHFIKKMNLFRGKSVSGISQEALALLMAHDFPGNIRELENVIEHAFVLCSEGLIGPHCLPDTFGGEPKESAGHDSINATIKGVEAESIVQALKRNNFNRLAAARDLGIHKSTLFRKIKKLGISLPETDGRTNHENTR
jgi:PAS domain S-box-containing protein